MPAEKEVPSLKSNSDRNFYIKTYIDQFRPNYRPISVLPYFSKLLERMMDNRLYKFLVENNILYQKQFGFQNAHSTEHAILQLVNQITEAFSQGKYTLGIFLELSKAFDTVNHNILLEKHIQISLQSCKRHELPTYYMVTC